jgi:hypothetical protein
MKAHVIEVALAAVLALGLAGSPALACTSDAECDDGLVCNGVETCNLGTMLCESGAPITCPPPGQCEESVDCQEPDGSCLATPKPDDVRCEDGVVCTVDDLCQGGVCVPGPGADTDDDGDCDAEEADCGCNPNDGAEVCVLPNRLVGRAGNRGGEVLMQWYAPEVRRVTIPTDPTCATAGVCTAGRCTAGRIRDLCTTNADCNLPPDTCRMIVNWADVPDETLIYAKIRFDDVPGFTPITPGCSRKVDVLLDPAQPVLRFRLRAQGTVDGRLRRDRDTFRYGR